MLDTGNLIVTKIYYWMLLRGYVYLHSVQNRSYFVFYHRKICKAETNGFGLVGLYLAPDNTTASHQLWELLVLVVSILSRLFFVVSLCSSFFCLLFPLKSPSFQEVSSFQAVVTSPSELLLWWNQHDLAVSPMWCYKRQKAPPEKKKKQQAYDQLKQSKRGLHQWMWHHVWCFQPLVRATMAATLRLSLGSSRRFLHVKKQNKNHCLLLSMIYV